MATREPYDKSDSSWREGYGDSAAKLSLAPHPVTSSLHDGHGLAAQAQGQLKQKVPDAEFGSRTQSLNLERKIPEVLGSTDARLRGITIVETKTSGVQYRVQKTVCGFHKHDCFRCLCDFISLLHVHTEP